MTPTDEIAALRCVVEAARNWRRLRVDGTGKEWVSAVDRLVAALDALPAASPPVVGEGETVDIRAVCLRAIADKIERVPKPRSYEMAHYCMGLEDAAMAIRDKITVRLPLIPAVEEPK
jgi:hypothetical protein